MYLSYIPKEIRHSFGEFFTPDILAREVVEKIATIKTKDKVIDPTCGSGTFLIEVINKKKSTNMSLEEIMKGFCGIDLNPINVLLARFNVLCNLLNELKASKSIGTVIPIYIGDTSHIPQITTENGIKVIKYDWISEIQEFEKIPEIILPLDFVRSKIFFDVMWNVKKGIEKGDGKISNYLIENIKELEKKTKKKMLTSNLEKLIKEWIETILNFHKNNLNSIWVFMFINYLYPFANAPYDMVIGNPPWVRWANLPTQYKNKIKTTLREKRIFSEDTNTGGVDLNIYALITYNSLLYLLKYKGILIFLLPQSSLQNKSLEGFRKLVMLEHGELVEPIYFFDGKIFEDSNLEFIILKLRRCK